MGFVRFSNLRWHEAISVQLAWNVNNWHDEWLAEALALQLKFNEFKGIPGISELTKSVGIGMAMPRQRYLTNV